MKLGALPVDDLKIKCTLFVKLCLCISWHFEKGKGRGRLWAQMPGLNEMNRFKKKKVQWRPLLDLFLNCTQIQYFSNYTISAGLNIKIKVAIQN